MFIALVLLVAVANAAKLSGNQQAPPGAALAGGYGGASPDASAQILRSENDNNGESYHYAYETSNGIQAQEQGQASVPGPEGNAVAAQGSFAYPSPDGQPIQLTYVADANGFQPQGAHLPTPPPIPEEILKSLEQNAAEEAAAGAQAPAYRN